MIQEGSLELLVTKVLQECLLYKFILFVGKSERLGFF